MKICPKCNKEHDKKGTYCSQTCSNGRKHSIETKQKIRKGILKAIEKNPFLYKNSGFKKGYDSRRNWTQEVIKKRNEKLRQIAKSKRKDNHKDIILEEQNGKCNRCGLITWLDKYIILELHHIDGNKRNNTRKNLEFLCPNCHSQTDGFRGRVMKLENMQVLETCAKA